MDEGKDDDMAVAQGKRVGDNKRGYWKAGYEMYICTYQRKTYLIAKKLPTHRPEMTPTYPSKWNAAAAPGPSWKDL